jgi:ElaB/YqjD/DUF883 family membrane-anchored ribosome-binding protein
MNNPHQNARLRLHSRELIVARIGAGHAFRQTSEVHIRVASINRRRLSDLPRSSAWCEADREGGGQASGVSCARTPSEGCLRLVRRNADRYHLLRADMRPRWRERQPTTSLVEAPGDPARLPVTELNMMQDVKTLKTAAQADYDQMAEQLASLREELAKVTRSLTGMAERRGRTMGSDLAEGFGEAVQYVERRGRTGEAEFEKAVSAHPFVALGLAAGAGLIIGALTRR